jgi:hypothetical protein
MTVKELKEMLKELGPEVDNCQVVMAKDSEGNSYSPVVDLTDTAYCEDASEYCIEGVYYDEHGYLGNCFDSKEEWENYKKQSDRVVVLHPMN